MVGAKLNFIDYDSCIYDVLRVLNLKFVINLY